MIGKFLHEEDGATAIEYALIASLIFLAIVAAIVPIGGALSGVFNSAAVGLNP